MASYIDWYVIELERRLNGRMPAESVFTLVSEVEDHLRLKREDLIAAGMDPAHAEKIATDSFGSASHVALEALEGSIEPSRVARGKALSLFAMIWIWSGVALISATGFVPELVLTVFAVCFLAGTVMFWVGSMSAGSQWRRVLALAGLGTVAITLLMPLGFRPVEGKLTSNYWIRNSLAGESRLKADIQTGLVRLKDGMAFYKQLGLVHGDLSKVTLKAPKYSDGSFIMLSEYEPVQFSLSSDRQPGPYDYGYGGSRTKHDLSQARDNWVKIAPGLLADARRQDGFLAQDLANLQIAAATPARFSMLYILAGLAVGTAMSIFFILLAATAGFLARLVRRRRIHRPLMA